MSQVIVTLLSGKGSPGTTTTAVALMLSWPGPVLLVEADPAGASIGFGYGQGIDMQGRGLLGAHVAARHGDPVAALWTNVVVLGEERWLLPGVAEPRQAAAVDYPALAATLARLGMDVIVDAGRFPGPGQIDALVTGADRVLVVLRPTLAGVHTAQTAVAVVSVGGVGSVIVGPGRPYSEAEVRAAMREIAPVAGCAAWDPSAAAVVTDGVPASRRWRVSPLLRSTTCLAAALTAGGPEPTEPPTPLAVTTTTAANTASMAGAAEASTPIWPDAPMVVGIAPGDVVAPVAGPTPLEPAGELERRFR